MIDLNNLTLTEIITIGTFLVAVVGGFFMSLINFFSSKKTRRVDETTKILNSAMEMVDRFDKIVDQVKLLEKDNISLREKIETLEKALMESPIYKKFFEMNKFLCLVLVADTGKIYDSNASFREMYGYTQSELGNMTVYDISLQPEETRNSIELKLDRIPSRLHKNKKGEAFLVEVRAIYHTVNGVNYIFCIYIPKIEGTIAQRIQDLLSQIIRTFDSDYSTIWVIHNGGTNKLSGLYEAVKTGNKYLLQDYRRIPATIFSDLFDELLKEKYVILNQEDQKHEPARLMLKHAEIETIVFIGVIYEGKLIGMLTTSWKKKKGKIDKCEIDKLIKYAESDLVRDVVINEVHFIQ